MSSTRSTPKNTQGILRQFGIGAHPIPFIEKDRSFSPKSVGDGLHTYGPAEDIDLTYLKGTLIAGANKGHKTGCPFGFGKFDRDGENGYASYLHLGTTRIWNADNTINEARWNKLVQYVEDVQGTDEKNILRKSTLHRYLKRCAAEDPPEKNTGRIASGGIFGFFSKYIQYFMASTAWDETFRLLSNDSVTLIDDLSKTEPYVDMKRIRLFFENSQQAFEEAKIERQNKESISIKCK